MLRELGFARGTIVALAVTTTSAVAQAQLPLKKPADVLAKPTMEQFYNPASPLELTSAKKADRIAWMVYERGMRNVYTAAAPAFKPVRLTSFLKDDGIDLTGLELSDDGSTVVFIRGSAANRDGWVANPSHAAEGPDRAIWAVSTSGTGVARRVASYAAFEVSPNGKYVLYVRDGQIYRGKTSGIMVDSVDRGQKPFISAWGRNSAPRWSPDGSKIAFASDRTTHAFIGLYDMVTGTVTYVAPGVDRDAMPTWVDNTHLMFMRTPGTPFGLQSTPGGGTRLPEVAGGRGAGGRGAAAAPRRRPVHLRRINRARAMRRPRVVAEVAIQQPRWQPVEARVADAAPARTPRRSYRCAASPACAPRHSAVDRPASWSWPTSRHTSSKRYGAIRLRRRQPPLLARPAVVVVGAVAVAAAAVVSTSMARARPACTSSCRCRPRRTMNGNATAPSRWTGPTRSSRSCSRPPTA
jgi:hypothetical protein